MACRPSEGGAADGVELRDEAGHVVAANALCRLGVFGEAKVASLFRNLREGRIERNRTRGKEREGLDCCENGAEAKLGSEVKATQEKMRKVREHKDVLILKFSSSRNRRPEDDVFK